MKELYERITHIRKERGLSIAEFAAKIGLASSSLQNIENGRINPSLEVILKSIQIVRNTVLIGCYMVNQ